MYMYDNIIILCRPAISNQYLQNVVLEAARHYNIIISCATAAAAAARYRYQVPGNITAPPVTHENIKPNPRVVRLFDVSTYNNPLQYTYIRIYTHTLCGRVPALLMLIVWHHHSFIYERPPSTRFTTSVTAPKYVRYSQVFRYYLIHYFRAPW